MAVMSMNTGVTLDRERVTIALLQDGKQLGWIEFTGEQCDDFMRKVAAYRAMLTDVLPGPGAPPDLKAVN